MSATPPWVVEHDGMWAPLWEWRVGFPNEVPTKYQAAQIPKEIFDALLAVAKAAAKSTASPDAPGAQAAIDAAVVALYDQHPGWREWQT